MTEEQKGEVVELLKEFQDVFTYMPGLTNLGMHSKEPVHSKLYSLPHVMQNEVEM